MNLRDLQNLIERGEYRQWVNKSNYESRIPFCADDGTLKQVNDDTCPNPYHPYLPPRVPNRSLLYLLIISICAALIYGIVTNEALTTLIITFLLVVISIITFTILLAIFVYLNAKFAPSPEGRERNRRFLGLLSSAISAVFAMMVIALLQGEFPQRLDYWIIEFLIAFVLESFVTDPLTLWIYSKALGADEAPGQESRDPLNRNVIQLYGNLVAFNLQQHLIFFGTGIAAGFWFLYVAFSDQPHTLTILLVYGSVIYCVFVFSLKHFEALKDSRLKQVISQDRLLCVQCIYAALKPAERERTDHPWILPFFYTFLITPLGSYVLAFIVIFRK